MKKITSFIILILLTLNFLVSPLYFLNIKEKAVWLNHKAQFKKRNIKIDSLILSAESATVENSNITYIIYYDNNKFVLISDNSKALFHSKKELTKTRKTLKYLEEHNDSLLIWYHPKLKGQIALAEENEINTNGFLLQIILNILFLLIAIGSVIWLIKKINNKNEEN